MLKFIAFLALIYLGYRTVRSLLPGAPIPPAERGPEAVDDVMVQDPQCEVYFPKRDGIAVRLNGRTVYFCSEKCKQAFLADQPGADDPSGDS